MSGGHASWQFARADPAHRKVEAIAMATSNVEFDFCDLTRRLSLLFSEAQPRVLEDLFKLVTDMPRDRLARFFSKLFKPAYLPMNRAGQHIAELRFVLPGGADELLAALRAYELDSNKIFAHRAIPFIAALHPMILGSTLVRRRWDCACKANELTIVRYTFCVEPSPIMDWLSVTKGYHHIGGVA
jgi:hypothetical protein